MENPFEAIEKRLEAIEKNLEGLIQRIDKPPVMSANTWITSKQLAQHLGISPAAVTKLRYSKLPFYKIGGKVLFKKQEIDEFIEKTRHKTGGEYLNEYLEGNQGNRGKSRY
jgi:excisionase family DNA binding protein